MIKIQSRWLAPAKISEAADMLKLLGNPNRLAILSWLSEGEASVGEMEDKLGIRQPTLSQQLGELRKAGLIDDRREAKVVFYRLADERVRAIVDYVSALFRGSGASPAKWAQPLQQDHQPSLATHSYAAVFGRILNHDEKIQRAH